MQVLTAQASFGHSDCERIADAALAQPVLALTSLVGSRLGLPENLFAQRQIQPLCVEIGGNPIPGARAAHVKQHSDQIHAHPDLPVRVGDLVDLLAWPHVAVTP
jgi:hypothetical protein